MRFTDLPEFDGHEMAVLLSDRRSGLRGVIAIHSTALGPATGGTRYAAYAGLEEAVRDALRLSRAMSRKCALAGVPYGGGKGVILALPRKSKRVFEAYADRVNGLGGNFTTGEDVGLASADLRAMRRISPFVNGRAGDLAPWAALGVFHAMKAALRETAGSASLSGRTILVKGLGKVGFELCRLVSAEGARVVGTDVRSEAVKKAGRAFRNFSAASPREIHRLPGDVFAPCALYGDLDRKTAKEMKAPLICGAANNQLADSRAGALLHRRGIVYVPDYVANAGGLLSVVSEMDPKGWNERWVRAKAEGIGDTVRKILRLSVREARPTDEIAARMAEKLIGRR